MQNDSAVTTPNFVELTSDVVSAYVSNNSVSRADLPALIGSVHAAVGGFGAGSGEGAHAAGTDQQDDSA